MSCPHSYLLPSLLLRSSHAAHGQFVRMAVICSRPEAIPPGRRWPGGDWERRAAVDCAAPWAVALNLSLKTVVVSHGVGQWLSVTARLVFGRAATARLCLRLARCIDPRCGRCVHTQWHRAPHIVCKYVDPLHSHVFPPSCSGVFEGAIFAGACVMLPRR
ncbi:hypothetical protein OH76DRAFT_491086 [Lentinus brumalis]|uniref:Uncharacterized protein n=1 Tax=Lentinus brumalis TaxID=2498619 RepID=A0A371DBE9_9APHY|nr:hypothetical protein OH76DRAFT_491086 [Polyporus brumalis]